MFLNASRVTIFALTLLLLVPSFSLKAQELSGECEIPDKQSCIDWDSGVAYAKGMGAVPANVGNRGYLLARRAARLDAMQKLTELIEGVNYDSSNNLANMVDEGKFSAGNSGFLSNVREIEAPTILNNGGTVEVTLYTNLRGIVPADVIKPTSAAFSFGGDSGTGRISSGKVYTGMIIDARSTDAAPALSPKILDPEGKEVYGSAFVDKEWVMTQGVAGYLKDLNVARENERVKGNPLVVKAVKAEGKRKTDLVVSAKAAQEIAKMAEQQTFLAQGRVIILLK